MSLLITIFLVLINIYNTIQTNSPQVWGSYQVKEEGGSWGNTRGFPSILTFFCENSLRIICLLPLIHVCTDIVYFFIDYNY